MSVIVDPKLGINVYAPFQSNQWEDSKKARRWLSFFASRVVMDTSCTALPASPAEGDTVLMSSSDPIHASEIARYSTELMAWEYMAPWAGLTVCDTSGNEWYFSGSAWVQNPTAGISALATTVSTHTAQIAELQAGGTGGGGGGGVSPTALALSVVDLLRGGCVEASGSFSVGVDLVASQTLNLTGIRFYGIVGRTYKISIWEGATRVATVTKSEPMAATGAATVALPSPLALTPYRRYRIMMFDLSSHYVRYPATDAFLRGPLQLNPWVVATTTNVYASGDAAPTNLSTTEAYPIEPVFA